MGELSGEDKKKIDESWKDAIRKDKASGAGEGSREEAPEASFGLFVTSLMMQALVALGEMENPVTKKKETSLAQSRFIIDTLEMLEEKTKNNLTKDESEMLGSILYELRMRFVAKSKKEG